MVVVPHENSQQEEDYIVDDILFTFSTINYGNWRLWEDTEAEAQEILNLAIH